MNKPLKKYPTICELFNVNQKIAYYEVNRDKLDCGISVDIIEIKEG